MRVDIVEGLLVWSPPTEARMNRRIFVLLFCWYWLFCWRARPVTKRLRRRPAPTRRPRLVEAYMGTPSKSEIALWESVREARRGAAERDGRLKSDLTNIPPTRIALSSDRSPFIQEPTFSSHGAASPSPKQRVPALALPAIPARC